MSLSLSLSLPLLSVPCLVLGPVSLCLLLLVPCLVLCYVLGPVLCLCASPSPSLCAVFSTATNVLSLSLPLSLRERLLPGVPCLGGYLLGSVICAWWVLCFLSLSLPPSLRERPLPRVPCLGRYLLGSVLWAWWVLCLLALAVLACWLVGWLGGLCAVLSSCLLGRFDLVV